MKGTTRTFLIVLAMATILATVATGAAVAGKGGGKGHHQSSSGGGSISLVLLNSTDGLPHYGQQVTFNVSTTATDKPSVQLTCSQGGVVVYRASAGFYPEYPWPWAQTFTLRSAAWTGGGADCIATLYYVDRRAKTQTLTTMSFPVYA